MELTVARPNRHFKTKSKSPFFSRAALSAFTPTSGYITSMFKKSKPISRRVEKHNTTTVATLLSTSGESMSKRKRKDTGKLTNHAQVKACKKRIRIEVADCRTEARNAEANAVQKNEIAADSLPLPPSPKHVQSIVPPPRTRRPQSLHVALAEGISHILITYGSFSTAFPDPLPNWEPRYHPLTSELNLIQERLYTDPWRLLVSTIFLNKTRGVQAVPVMWQYFERWSNPASAADADESEVANMLRSLGLHNTRARRLIKFARSYLLVYPAIDRSSPARQFFGIGKYGEDSFRLFCGERDDFWVEGVGNVDDKELKKYVEWRREMAGDMKGTEGE